MDMTGALNNAQAILLALLHRDTTGQGMHIDASMYETGVTAIGPALLEVQKSGVDPPPSGNEHPWMAPHGCYPCLGDDRWVVIAVGSDQAWEGLRQIMGDPGWARDHRFDTVTGRHEHRAELDASLAAWTAQQDEYPLFHALQEAGVAAGPVLDGKDLLLDPHLRDRAFFQRETSPVPRVGTRVYPGRPYRLSRTPGVTRPAAAFGADNDYVLRELLGLSQEQVQRLTDEGVIATEPDPDDREPPEAQAPEELLRRHAIRRYDPDYRRILGLDQGRSP
jgi:benzylsuccinate CoA-transferase BbsF subunit